jgi:DNA-binding PadR family transcriptional regulator
MRTSMTNTIKSRLGSSTVRELFVLGMISGRPMYGHELMRLLALSHAEMWVELSEKHVYQLVRKLEGDGLIRGKEERSGRRPPRRRFTITPAGRQALRAMCDDDRNVFAIAFSPFDTVLAVLGAGDVNDQLPLPILRRRRAYLAQRMAEQHPASQGPLIEAQFGRIPRWMFEKARRLLKAELGWLDDVIADASKVGWPAMRVRDVALDATAGQRAATSDQFGRPSQKWHRPDAGRQRRARRSRRQDRV